MTISPRSLDEQESLIREKFEGNVNLFTQEKGALHHVVTGVSAGHADWLGMVQCPGPMFDTVKPFDSSNTGKFVHLQSFSSEPTLWVAFGLPATLTSYVRSVSTLSIGIQMNTHYASEKATDQRLDLPAGIYRRRISREATSPSRSRRRHLSRC